MTFSWRRRHQHALYRLPNLFSLLSRPRKYPIIAVVVGCSPAVSPWEGVNRVDTVKATEAADVAVAHLSVA
jgi:hypothetical protein